MSFKCSKCGHELSDEAKFCSACGAKQQRQSAVEKLEEGIRTKGKPRMRILGAMAAVLVLIGAGGAVLMPGEATRIMPAVVDMTAGEALHELSGDDLNEDEVQFVDEDGNIVEDPDGWVVVDQYPSVDEKVNADEEQVVLTVFDKPGQEREERLDQAEEELTDAHGMTPAEALNQAEGYDLTCALLTRSGEDCTDAYEALDAEDQEAWEVISVDDFNRDEMMVAFVVDTKDHIAFREKKALKKCLNMTAPEALEQVSSQQYEYELIDSEGERYNSNYLALSQKERKQWIVTKVSRIDTDKKKITLSIDTKEHIKAKKEAARKKAAREKARKAKAKREAARKKKEAEAAAAAAAAAGLTRSAGSSGEMVWIPRTGHKYHSNPSCSNMKNPTQVTRAEAENRGYGACSKCY